MSEPQSRSDSPTERTAIRPPGERQTSDTSCLGWCYPRRYWVAFMAFLGFCNVYALRVNLSVAIVAMTTNKTVMTDAGPKVEIAEFDWDPEIQGMVLSSFFYGYILTQIPGGYLATNYGGRRLFGIGVAATSFLTLITPVLVHSSLYLFMGARVLEGLFEGVTYPAIHAIWSRWSPPLERTKLATIAFSGSYFGTVIALPVSGFLAEHLGWVSIFYVFGIVAFIWSIIWTLFVFETPSSDPHISEAELDYIRATVGSAVNHVKVNVPVPWKRILTSMPVWAIVIAHFSENWGFYTLLTGLPTFMNDMFQYDLQKAGLLAALPYLAMGIVVQVGGFLADWLRANGSLSTTRVRKLFNCSGFIYQTIFLLLAVHAGSPAIVIVCLTFAVGLGGFGWAGFSVNHLDIAPPYASILMGLSNTFATLPGMISPVITGYLVQHKTPEEWHMVFYIASGIYLVGAIFYGIFASGDEQSWARISSGLLTRDELSTNTDDMPFGEGSCE